MGRRGPETTVGNPDPSRRAKGATEASEQGHHGGDGGSGEGSVKLREYHRGGLPLPGTHRGLPFYLLPPPGPTPADGFKPD